MKRTESRSASESAVTQAIRAPMPKPCAAAGAATSNVTKQKNAAPASWRSGSRMFPRIGRETEELQSGVADEGSGRRGPMKKQRPAAVDRRRSAKHPAKVLTLIMDTNTGPARYGPQRSAPGRLQRGLKS